MKEKLKELISDKSNIKRLTAIFVVLILLGLVVFFVLRHVSNGGGFNDLKEDATSPSTRDFESTTAEPTTMPTTEEYTEPSFIMPKIVANDMEFIVPKWRPDLKYNSYGDLLFNEISYTPKGATTSSEKLDGMLGECLITVYNNADETLEALNVNGTVYKIFGVSPEVCVAVKMESDDGYHIFANYRYYPATIQSLVDDFGLLGNLQVNKVYYRDANGNEKIYTLKNHNDLFDKLLDDRMLTNGLEAGYEENPPVVISVTIEAIGDDNVSIALNDSGILQTNIMGIASTYEIGQDKVSAFKKYLEKNCESEEYKG